MCIRDSDFGEEELINDVGMFQCATISGDVWFDLDMDGIYDPAEKGINGLRVYIIDAMTGATVTTLTTSVKPGTPSDDGYYIASCLKPGMYYVKFERPGHLGASEPYKGTNPNKDSDISHENGVNTTKKITLNPGQNVLNAVSYTHLRAHETVLDLVCRLLLEKKKNTTQ